MQRSAASRLLPLFFLLVGTFSVSQAQLCEVDIATSPDHFCRGEMVTLSATPASVMLTNPADSLNFHRGVMFDLSALQTIVIEDFYVRPKQLTDIEVYYKIGSYDGWENTPSVWTLIGSVFNIPGATDPVPLGLALDLEIPLGQTYGFYITSTDPTISMYYNNGIGEGTLVTGDAQLSLISGGGLEYPFGGSSGGIFEPRDFYGTIKYRAAADFSWSTGATGSSITVPADGSEYVLSANFADLGCTAHDTAVLMGSPEQVLPPLAYLCEGNDLLLEAGTNPFYSYLWSDGTTGASLEISAAGWTVGESFWQSASIDDGLGCTAVDSVSVMVTSGPVISLPDEIYHCIGNSNILDAGAGLDYTYTWSTGETTQTIDLEDAGLSAGVNTISVVVTSPENCATSKTMLVEAAVCTGISDAVPPSLQLYPNPVSDVLNIGGLDQASSWEIYDQLGRLISAGKFTSAMGSQVFSINTSELESGAYILKIEGTDQSYIQPFVR